MDIYIKRITEQNKADINIKNEPFPLCGRMIPLFDGENWSFKTERYPTEKYGEMTFPDENYSYEKLSVNSFFVGAYDGANNCIGIAIYQKSWNKYLYLYDLKVNKKYRRQGIAKMLIAEGGEIAEENGYNGIYTQGQDNNLNACLFYISVGFKIGGTDTYIYKGTKQAGKSDIIFYYELKNIENGS